MDRSNQLKILLRSGLLWNMKNQPPLGRGPPTSVALRRDADDVVGCRDMQTTSKRPYRVTVARMTPVSSPDKTNMSMPVPVPMRKGGSASNLNPIRPA